MFYPGLTYEGQGRHDVTQLDDGQGRTVKFDAKPVEVMSRPSEGRRHRPLSNIRRRAAAATTILPPHADHISMEPIIGRVDLGVSYHCGPLPGCEPYLLPEKIDQ